MKKLALALMLGVGAVGALALPEPAAAQRRVYVDFDDIVYIRGRPYDRWTREPVYLVSRYGEPRYYRIVERRYGPRRDHVVVRYAPPYGYRTVRYREPAYVYDYDDWR